MILMKNWSILNCTEWFSRKNYLESNIEDGVDVKHQFRIENCFDPIFIREPVWKNSVDNISNDPSIKKNSAHVDFKDKSFDSVRLV